MFTTPLPFEMPAPPATHAPATDLPPLPEVLDPCAYLTGGNDLICAFDRLDPEVWGICGTHGPAQL